MDDPSFDRLEAQVAGLAGDLRALQAQAEAQKDHVRLLIDHGDRQLQTMVSFIERGLDDVGKLARENHDRIEASEIRWSRVVGIAIGVGATSGLGSGGILFAILRALGQV